MSDSITVAFRTGARGRMSVPEMPVGEPPTREARESAAKSLFGPRGTQRRSCEFSEGAGPPPSVCKARTIGADTNRPSRKRLVPLVPELRALLRDAGWRRGVRPRVSSSRLRRAKSLLNAQSLAALYPSHGAYVNRVVRRVQELVQQGWLLAEDAQAIRNEAAAAQVPSNAAIP